MPVKKNIVFRETRQTLRKVHKYPIQGGNYQGILYDVKVFPPSKPGKAGFKWESSRPSSTNFKKWFDWYVQVVGWYVERLNALQFNLDEASKPGGPSLANLRKAFQRGLAELADEMQIGKSHNPKKLVWPLDGVYVCELEQKIKANGPAFRALLVVSFEADADYRLVTNCSVQLIQPAAFNKPNAVGKIRLINWDSSSSSSLATSSSSGGTRPLPPP